MTNTLGVNPFWKRLQKNMNVLLNDSCTKGWDETIMVHIEVDDDKVHLNHKIATDNVRRVRHAIDNRVGIVCHALAFTSTEVLVAFEFETQNGTKSSAVIRLIKNDHAPSSAELSLNHVRHAMDRGYWSFKVTNKSTEAGSQVCGTAKICPWLPHAHGKLLKKDDNRILFEENRMRLVKTKKLK